MKGEEETGRMQERDSTNTIAFEKEDNDSFELKGAQYSEEYAKKLKDI
ncbi:MAG: hypothetical protein ACC608_00700 [Anaerofustis sp.]